MSIHRLGYVGTALVIVAYLPQIHHLIREKCSAALASAPTLSGPLRPFSLLVYAITRRDPVFTALHSYQVLAAGVICFYSKHSEDSLCELHGGPRRSVGRSTTPIAPSRDGDREIETLPGADIVARVRR
jgi:uncharacterized protein with PQ loop repeat